MRGWWVAALLLVWAGCDETDPEADAGRDAGSARTDGGGDDDAGGPMDGGPDVDSGAVDAGPPAGGGPWRVYVTVGGERRLAVLEVQTDGTMSERSDLSLDLGGRPGALAYDGASRFYVGIGGGMSGFATVSIDVDGAPSLEGRTTGTPNPVYLAAAPGGRLVSAYFGADEARVHDVSDAPPHAELSVLSTSDEPHAIRMGPGGRFYMPHRTGGTTWWLSLAGDGTLSMDGEAMSDSGDGPRHVAFAPDGEHVYVVNEFTDSVGTYTRAADGSLSRVATETTLPAGANGGANTCADIHITPDGSTVFASNRGHDSIARLRVEADGTLTFVDATPTEMTPREFELTGDGSVLLALGQGNGFVQSYTVAADGALTMVERLSVGDDLRWAIALSVD